MSRDIPRAPVSTVPIGEDILRKLRENAIERVEFVGVALEEESFAAFAEALRHNVSVKTLGLRNVGMDDAGATTLADALGRNASIARLDLEGNRIGDAGLKSLADRAIRNSNGALSHLNLDGNEYGSEGAAALADAVAENASLEVLRVGGPAFGDAETKLLARAIQRLDSIKQLFINADLGYEGIMSLAILLKRTNCMETLHMKAVFGGSMCPKLKLGNEAAKALACAAVLNTSLTRLVINQPSMEKQGWNSLLTAKRLLDGTEEVSDEDLASFMGPFMDGSSPMNITLADVGRCRTRAARVDLLPKLNLVVTPRNIDERIWQLRSRAGQRRVLQAVSKAGLERLREEVFHSSEGVFPIVLERVGPAVGAAGVYEMMHAKPELFQ